MQSKQQISTKSGIAPRQNQKPLTSVNTLISTPTPKPSSKGKTSKVVPIRSKNPKQNIVTKNGITTKSNSVENHGIKPSTRGPSKNPSVRMPEINGDKIQERLKRKSPWFDSLINPVSGATVKIPDAIGVATGTYQFYQEVSVAANANGVAGLRVLTPYLNQIVDTGGGVGSNYQTTTTASAITPNLEWGYPGAAAGGGFAGFAGNQALAPNIRGARIVSAIVMAFSETTSLTDKGEITGFSCPFGAFTAADYNTVLAAYGSSSVAINMKKAMSSLWYPVSVRNQTSGTIDYKDFIDPIATTFYSAANPNGIPIWSFGVIGIGLDTTSVLKFKICINYEFIPRQNLIDIVSASPSPVDLQEEELVIGWTDDLPKSGTLSAKRATEAPSISSVEDNGSGFGMFFDVLEELVPYAAKAAPYLLSLL